MEEDVYRDKHKKALISMYYRLSAVILMDYQTITTHLFRERLNTSFDLASGILEEMEKRRVVSPEIDGIRSVYVTKREGVRD